MNDVRDVAVKYAHLLSVSDYGKLLNCADLIDRLQAFEVDTPYGSEEPEITQEAATEIKRLRALCDEWKVLAVEWYEPQIAKQQAEIERLKAKVEYQEATIKSLSVDKGEDAAEIERLNKRVAELEAKGLKVCAAFSKEVVEAEAEIDQLKDALRTIYTWNASGDYQRDLFRMKDFAIAALKGEK